MQHFSTWLEWWFGYWLFIMKRLFALGHGRCKRTKRGVLGVQLGRSQYELSHNYGKGL